MSTLTTPAYAPPHSYATTRPPEARITSPVIQADSSDANKIVILTGAGGNFIPGIDFATFGNVADPDLWSQRPGERFAVWHYFGDHSPLVRDSRRKRLRLQQKSLGSTCSGAVAPRGEDSIAGHNTPGEMGNIVERSTFRRHNYAGEQGILGVHMGASFNRCNYRHAYVGNVLENLNTFIMNLKTR